MLPRCTELQLQAGLRESRVFHQLQELKMRKRRRGGGEEKEEGEGEEQEEKRGRRKRKRRGRRKGGQRGGRRERKWEEEEEGRRCRSQIRRLHFMKPQPIISLIPRLPPSLCCSASFPSSHPAFVARPHSQAPTQPLLLSLIPGLPPSLCCFQYGKMERA